MQTQSFNEAVAAAIAEFTQSGQNFSAHDVTTAIRAKVNSNQLEIAGAVREDVDNTPDTFRINHNDVRSQVLDSYQRGQLPLYTQQYSKSGGYRVFNFIGATSQQVVPVAVPTVAPATVQTPSAISPTELQTKVEAYLSHKHGQRINPTFKQIQSRLKGVAVTCVELETLVRSLGYGIIPSNTQSESQVGIVI